MVRYVFIFSSRRRHTRYWRDWSSDVCSSDLGGRSSGACPAPCAEVSRRRRPGRADVPKTASSGAGFDVAPEGVDARVPVVRDLLERLVGFLFHDLEAGAGDQLGDGAAQLGAAGGVESAGEHE